jgi:hypothetical protein
MVRVSDGGSALYLLPAEFEALSDEMLRTALSLASRRKVVETEAGAPTVPSRAAQTSQAQPSPVAPTPKLTRTPAVTAATPALDDKAGSVTSPRRAGRPAQSLW